MIFGSSDHFVNVGYINLLDNEESIELYEYFSLTEEKKFSIEWRGISSLV